MGVHARFHFKNLEALKLMVGELHLSIPFENDFSNLFESVSIGPSQIHNRLAAHPMEGFDADWGGSPQNLSFRRYQRYAAGGAALIWFEATAVVAEGRSNPNQFYLHPKNVTIFKKLVAETRRVAATEFGKQPLLILQLTHSGRYSKPEGTPTPIIAHHSPILDPQHHLAPDYPLVSDDYLDTLQEKFIDAARLAFEAGFDGVDVKSCHRYLVSELLASFTRENSRYGGSFDNRTRFLRETLGRIRQQFPEKIITTRLNVFDAISFPYGFGVSEDDYHLPDLREPLRLIGLLKAIGMPLINISIGNPYFNPHFGRPYDFPIRNGRVPDEHPLEGIARFLEITRQVQQTYPDLAVIGSGYSWLRQFFPYVAAGVIKSGGATLIGQGRGMFAYPDSVKDLKEKGRMNPRKVCVTCSACTQIMRDGSQTGCVVRDNQIYGPIYRQIRRMAPDVLVQAARRCRDCDTPTCREKCPAQVDIPNFIKAFAEGNLTEAYQHLVQNNLLPEICAYVCPAEVQCEGACIEKIFTGEPVRIRDIQNAVARAARKQGLVRVSIPEKSTGKRVAIIGAGVAGLTCAASLVQQGHSVTVFDGRTKPGGIVRSLLPQNRISAQTVDFEVQALLAEVPEERLKWELGQSLNTSSEFDQLVRTFDAVFLAMGLTEAVRLFDNPPGLVWDALTFLEKIKSGNNLTIPGQVAVIGGGNSAMDAAVAAKAADAGDVYLIYRRSFAELPAWPMERNQALDLGVHFLILTQPVAYLADEHNQLQAIRLVRTRLGEPDASGRRRPHIIPGSEAELPVQMIIEAIGQKSPANLGQVLVGVQLDANGLIALRPNSQMTTREGVFAGGDIVNGGTTAAQAVADGIRAANEIHDYLFNPS